MKPRQLAGLFLMLAGLAMTTLALALLWLAPQVFLATARVVVGPAQAATNRVNTTTQYAGGAGWEPSELERIQAKRVLFQVITNLDLQRKWGGQLKAEGPLPLDKTYELLKRRMVVRQSKDTSILDIGVKSYAPDEAATLANRVAEAYRDTRRAEGTAVEVVDMADLPPKGQRSGGTQALALFLVGLAGLGSGYWVLRSAGLLRPTAPAAA